MKNKYNPGDGSRKRANANKAAILEYFQKWPFDTQTECADALGLTQATVSRHSIALKIEMDNEK